MVIVLRRNLLNCIRIKVARLEKVGAKLKQFVDLVKFLEEGADQAELPFSVILLELGLD